MILIKLFKLDAITLKQRLMVKFFIIFMMLHTLSLTCVFAAKGKLSHIRKIVLISYFTAQCNYKAEIMKCHNLIKSKCVFYLEIWNDNCLDCLVGKLTIARIPLHRELILNCDYYCGMLYLLPYSTFVKLPIDLFGTENVVDDGSGDEDDGEDEDVFKVDKILGICYGDP
ncbi:dna (cytosine-5)-methyltransferase cmt3 [Quercus suber]|uniref:Dna (Cytosine-5)-methyltransferase cmt3 n=1 Tax=Quercus suber TaxID=58331 RepID=A0AAW0K4M2_QUESU